MDHGLCEEIEVDAEPGRPVTEERLRRACRDGWLLRNIAVAELDALTFHHVRHDGPELGETPAILHVNPNNGTGETAFDAERIELHMGCGDICGVLAVLPYDGDCGGVDTRAARAIANAGADLIDLAREVVKLRAERPDPIPMILWCPACGTQHVDAPEPATGWTNPPHRSHRCKREGCGTVWRPADVATVGVSAIRTRGREWEWDQGQLGSSSMTGLPVAWSLFSGAIGRLIGVYYHGGFAQEAVVKALKVHEHVRVQAWRGEKVVQPADWSWLDLPGGCTSEIVDDARVYRRAT